MPGQLPGQRSKEVEMSFLDHLEELRWHLIRSIIGVIVMTIVAFLAKDFIFHTLIFGPTREEFATYMLLCGFSHLVQLGNQLCIEDFGFSFINVQLTGQFFVHLKVSLVVGFIVAFPYVFWEMWRFARPALYENEVNITRGIVFFSSLLFFAGVLFGYYILTPFSLNFFGNYQVTEQVTNSFTLPNYVGFLSMFVLASGIIFELPMVIYFLAKIGLVTPEAMRSYRKHAFVGILVVAAIITPADLGTQILVTFPVFILYEFSILIAKREQRKRQQKEQEDVLY
jgi:sec-independent protein translocase protein TatC